VLDGTEVLDAFCGTGALAFESLSRGAKHATLFDKDRQALMIAKKNAAHLGIQKSCSISAADMLAPPKAPQPSRLIFLAPPYRKNMIPPALEALDKTGWLAPHPLIVAETAKSEALKLPPTFDIMLARSYGDTTLHFVKRTSPT
jgi:16S rRNA (guanine966-N2)-methyltransferase